MMDPLERMMAKVTVTDDGCWEISGHRRRMGGYVLFNLGWRRIVAHRASWILHNGPIPEGMCVLHRCDNPPCVNPEHLWLGTQSDNVYDAIKKGRHATAK